MPSQNQYRHSLLHTIVPFAASGYLYFTGATTRIRWEKNDAVRELEKANRNFIYAVWHDQQAFLIYSHRRNKVCALVSQSKDGEYMARMLPRFGMEAVRGSTSKGGIQALLGLLDKAKDGYHPVLTPDGPRGPRHTIQPGIIFLAGKTGLPVVPIACGLSHKKVFRSWDRFRLPLPFGKAAIVYGDPIYVSETDDQDAKAAELQKVLNNITEQADQMAA